MELNVINNSTLNNVQHNDVSHLQKTDVASKISELNKDSITISTNTNDIPKRSDIANSVSGYINEIAGAQSVSSMITTQIQSIDNIQNKINTISSGTSTQEKVQPDVAQFISKYNSTSGTINEKISTLSDLNGDSTTYFDGEAGATPLNIDMLNNTMATKRSELSTTLGKVQEVNDSFKALAQNVISKEVEKVQNESPFKEINFGKESADFNSTNMTNLVGSIASSQANASQMHGIRLLS